MLASAIVDKYIGESARVIREMFGYAREHQPCVIFMDEVCYVCMYMCEYVHSRSLSLYHNHTFPCM